MPCLFLTLDQSACASEQQADFISALSTQLGLSRLSPDRIDGQRHVYTFHKSARQPSWIRAALDLHTALAGTFDEDHFHAGLSLSRTLKQTDISAPIGRTGAQLVWPGMSELDTRDLAKAQVLPGDLNLDFENRTRWPLATQSVLDLRTQTSLYSEILARSADLDLNSASFVPGLEARGQIAALDREIVQRALTALAAQPDLRLGINASRLSVLDAGWQAGFNALSSPAVGQRLFVEITETFSNPVDQKTAFIEALHTLKNRGIQLVLDDLGRGATSLSEMMHLPFDFVKLDRGLVKVLKSRQGDYDFLSDLNDLSQSQPWKIIAEGASDRATYNFIQRSGVAFAQGFAIDHPVISEF